MRAMPDDIARVVGSANHHARLETGASACRRLSGIIMPRPWSLRIGLPPYLLVTNFVTIARRMLRNASAAGRHGLGASRGRDVFAPGAGSNAAEG